MTPIRELRIDDRRAAITQRRKSSRAKMLNGARIVWITGGPVKCTVRNLSRTGACVEVHEPIPDTFDLVLDCDELRYSCAMVWQHPPRMGVKFQ
jgi:PilZ domain